MLGNGPPGATINWRTSVPKGTQVELVIPVSNSFTSSLNCRVTGILDREGKESFDESATSGSSLVSNTPTNPKAFTVPLGAVDTVGTLYFAAKVLSNYDGNYVLTDTSDYSPTQYLTITPSYTMKIDVDNVDGGLDSVPETHGRVNLYDSNWSLLAENVPTGQYGVATFENRPAGNYNYRVYVVSPSGLGTEFWGWGTVTLSGDQTFPHKRNWPIAAGVSVFAGNAVTGATIDWRTSVPAGTVEW